MEIHYIFYSTTYATYIWTLKCAMLQPDMFKTLVLYHSGPLMYVYVRMHTNEMFYQPGEVQNVYLPSMYSSGNMGKCRLNL